MEPSSNLQNRIEKKILTKKTDCDDLLKKKKDIIGD
jgi:hypothetical protein